MGNEQRDDLHSDPRNGVRNAPRLVVGLGVVGIGVVLVAIASALATDDTPSSVEVSLFRWLNDPPAAIDAVLGFVDPLLRPIGLVIVAAGLVALLLVTRRQEAPSILVAVGAAAVLAWALDNALKRIVERGRPPSLLDDVLTHGYPVDPRGTGFPSSHTAIAVAVVVAAWPWLDRSWRLGGVVLAAAIALDRIYVGAHFPVDVIGGVGVGLIAGGIVLAAGRCWRARRTAPVSDR